MPRVADCVPELRPARHTTACRERYFDRLFRFGGQFLEARIIPKRIEHRIEPEQRGSERHA